MDLAYLGAYPRPDMARRGFQSLEGEWELEYDPDDVGITRAWASSPFFSRCITVPFCV